MPAKKRILVVDDTPANIKVLNDILKDIYHVSVATNGRDAIKLATAKPKPDLILLDIMMPGMDGYEVCRQLKTGRSTSAIPVIFVTAMGKDADESKGFEVGCVDYITKPISPPRVLARIKTHLSLKEAYEDLTLKNKELIEAGKLKQEVENITRHDLKNPLTGIYSGIDLLLFAGGLTPDQEDTIEIMKDSADKMLEIINSSLDMFKMERGLYILKPVDVDLIQLSLKIQMDFRSLTKSNKTGIEISLDDMPLENGDSSIVKGEILLIYSILANLIKNAIQATPENEVINILLSSNDSTSTIAIKNKGAIPEEIQSTFFDKFVTSGNHRGTGIGTYSAKLIAHTLGGNISMTSSEDDGTTILIELPL
jgi:CheY-like chemotaxis protein